MQHVIDLELSREISLPNSTREYWRIDRTTLRSTSRNEDAVFRDVVSTRGRHIPVFVHTFASRVQLSTNSPVDIDTLEAELKARELVEGIDTPINFAFGDVTQSNVTEF